MFLSASSFSLFLVLVFTLCLYFSPSFLRIARTYSLSHTLALTTFDILSWFLSSPHSLLSPYCLVYNFAAVLLFLSSFLCLSFSLFLDLLLSLLFSFLFSSSPLFYSPLLHFSDHLLSDVVPGLCALCTKWSNLTINETTVHLVYAHTCVREHTTRAHPNIHTCTQSHTRTCTLTHTHTQQAQGCGQSRVVCNKATVASLPPACFSNNTIVSECFGEFSLSFHFLRTDHSPKIHTTTFSVLSVLV